MCLSRRCRDKKAISSRSSVQEETAAISELLDTRSQEKLRQLLKDEYGEAPGDDEADESDEDEEAQMPQLVLLTSSTAPPCPPCPPSSSSASTSCRLSIATDRGARRT